MGDPRGIGPEVAVRALELVSSLDAEFLLIGPAGLPDVPGELLDPIGRWGGGETDGEAGNLCCLAIERAVRLALDGEVDAIVTAPISKPAIAAAGRPWPGHTEMLRDLTGVPETALCLAADDSPLGSPLRVVLVTGHMALRDVPAAYDRQTLVRKAELADKGLRRLWGFEAPRLGVCALNPHASDGGLFGDEEARVIDPAMRVLRERGIRVAGPYPADTVFVKAMRGELDAVLTPYHDLGMTAIKTAAFGKAVNVTLGLPFPRTSPDHGTAFDIAGTGRADPGSMRAALEAAVAFARRALTASAPAGRFSDE